MRIFSEQVRKMSLALAEDLDTPRSLTVAILIRHGEWDQLANLRVDPALYLDATSQIERFRRDYQITELLRKFDGLPVVADREQVAKDGFWACEAQCKRTNDRLDKYLYAGADCSADMRILEFISDVKKLIATWLGAIPRDITPKFGPGAIFESKEHRHGRRLTLMDKLTMTPATTSDAAYFLPFFWSDTAWARGLSDGYHDPAFTLVRGNRFTTVPKDATKDRGICIEPGLNVWLQLGVGTHLKRRLLKAARLNLGAALNLVKGDWVHYKRHGTDDSYWYYQHPLPSRDDLDEGQRRHRERARVASVDGKDATIDLSNASDTVAWKLVKLLLPDQWFDLLDSLRSKFTLIDGRWVRLEKFSSMGNGFTFELETLIFAAISSVASGGRVGSEVLVYGDDIIVPSSTSPAVLAALRFFGFTPNERKTFHAGVFRESCGGDYFMGENVRPYYLKELPDVPAAWIAVANGLWRASHIGGCVLGRPYRRARSIALGFMPSAIRKCRGPEQLGDLVIWDSPKFWQVTVRSSIRYIRIWRPIQKTIPLRHWNRYPLAQLAGALSGVPSLGPTPRDAVTGYRFGRAAFS